MQRPTTRRRFLRLAAGTGALSAAAPVLLPARVLGRDGQPGPNDQIGLAGIGLGRRGAGVFRNAAGKSVCRAVAIADVNKGQAEKIAKAYGAEACQDYRKVLDRDDVDAIVTATPDHWRALVCIHAAQAGKDIYGEKPMTLTIREGRLMVDAVRKYNRVFQTGSQQRSMAKNRFGCELIRNGRIGKIKQVLAKNFESPWFANLPAQSVPAGLDWDMWCGPVDPVPYNIDVCAPRRNPGWISLQPFSGGEMTGWGAHGLDQIQWALGMDETGPVEIWTEGEPFDPPTFTKPHSRDEGNAKCRNPIVFMRYANGVEVKFDGGSGGGGIFIGEKGKIEISRNRLNANPAEILDEPIKDDEIHLYKSNDHVGNWLECIKTRERCVADVEIGHRSTTVCHLGNIARWTGRPLKWDPDKEQFIGDDDANQYLDRPRRKGYELPDTV